MNTSHEDLHKHGYRPHMRWGALKETLVAACILESGILQKAAKTGKLFVWDPFCGSGIFIIECLQMALRMPCRTLEEEMPFENWPIHEAKLYEEFKKQLSDFQTEVRTDSLEVKLIGSDVSQYAIETAEKNIALADFDRLLGKNFIKVESQPKIESPLVLQSHWPRNLETSNIQIKNKESSYISLY